jgi:hypothetical protein
MGKDRDKGARKAKTGASSAGAAAMVAAMGGNVGITFAAFDTSLASGISDSSVDSDIGERPRTHAYFHGAISSLQGMFSLYGL